MPAWLYFPTLAAVVSSLLRRARETPFFPKSVSPAFVPGLRLLHQKFKASPVGSELGFAHYRSTKIY